MKEKSWFEKKMDELKEWKEDHEAEIISTGAVLIVTAPIFLLGLAIGGSGKRREVRKAQAKIAQEALIAQVNAYDQGFADGVSSVVIEAIKEAKS